MSKRFGRNQRRRARERIAQLEQEQDRLLQHAARDIGEKHALLRQLDQAEHFQREVAEIVGREAIIAGAPVNLDYRYLRRERHMDPIVREPYQPLPPFPVFSESATMTTLRTETLHLLNIETVADVMRNQMQAYIELDGAEVVYAVSGSALRRMTADELRRTVAGEVARQLVDQLKGKMRL